MHDAGETRQQSLSPQNGVVPQGGRVSRQQMLQRFARLVPRLFAQPHEGVERGREENVALRRQDGALEKVADGREIEHGIADGDADARPRIRRSGEDPVGQVLDREIRIRRDGNPRHDRSGIETGCGGNWIESLETLKVERVNERENRGLENLTMHDTIENRRTRK